MEFRRINKTEYNNVDCIKLCMAVLVVATHTSLFQSLIRSPQIYDAVVTALAVKVPFFFAASGFLVWNKLWNATIETKLVRIGRWIKKTFKLYTLWTVIYLPLTIYGLYLDDLSFMKSLMIFIRNVLLVGENFYSWQLWYLLGMLVGGCMLYCMIRLRLPQSSLYFIAGLLAVCGVTIEYFSTNDILPAFCNQYHRIFYSTRNGLFEGLPYILIGVSIADSGVIKSRKVLWMLFIGGFLAHMADITLATFVMTYALFSLVVQFDFKTRTDDLYKNMRLVSTVVYLIHMLWVALFTFIFPIKNTVMLFICVVIASFGSAYFAVKYKDTKIVRLLVR